MSYFVMQNILRGKVPTASTWDTAPTSLANCTDGNVSTVTGTGSKVLGGAGTYGVLDFDMNGLKYVSVSGKFGIWTSAGSAGVYIQTSEDNITYSPAVAGHNLTSTTSSGIEIIVGVWTFSGYCRYIRLNFYVSAAATANAKIYEVAAWELRL